MGYKFYVKAGSKKEPYNLRMYRTTISGYRKNLKEVESNDI